MRPSSHFLQSFSYTDCHHVPWSSLEEERQILLLALQAVMAGTEERQPSALHAIRELAFCVQHSNDK